MEKIVLIGAGSAVFTRGLVADLIRTGWQAELRLVDTNPQALAVAQQLAAKMIALKQAPIRLSADPERRNLLPGPAPSSAPSAWAGGAPGSRMCSSRAGMAFSCPWAIRWVPAARRAPCA
jgi:hypothetical protein